MTTLNIIFEDAHILVVEKAPRVPSQADISGDPDMLSLCKSHIKANENKPGNVYLGLVHRLDRPVGGLMVFAKRSKAAARISKQIQNRSFQKTYVALLEGSIQPESGELTHYLVKDKKKKKAVVYITESTESKQAVLNYKLIEKVNDNSLVEIELRTGRFHQIRAQFAFMGHPIVGDTKYLARSKHTAEGIALYASRLSFQHPISSEQLTFEKKPLWMAN